MQSVKDIAETAAVTTEMPVVETAPKTYQSDGATISMQRLPGEAQQAVQLPPVMLVAC